MVEATDDGQAIMLGKPGAQACQAPTPRHECRAMTHLQRSVILALLALSAALSLSSCVTGGAAAAEQLALRKASIAAEPRGDFYYGRRFHIERTQFWGYLRRPGQDWTSAKLVVMGEQQTKTPDRRPEMPNDGGLAYGFDHNHDYRICGHFSGKKIYDPNSNLFLPEFVLQRYELLNTHPGWLFKPGERFNGNQLMRPEPDAMP
jgi:hypothetical protein